MYDIVVIGAGIVGLSTAINIQKLVPDRHVTLIADKFTRNTTSDGAAGSFRPTLELTTVKSIDRFRQWCLDSWHWYHSLYLHYDPRDTGVTRISGYQFTDSSNTPYPFHHDIIYEFHELTQSELNSLPGNKKHGWKYTTLMTESRRYLPWLLKQFEANRGKIEERKITSIDEFAGNCSVLVNCSGLASKSLFKDHGVYPVRGHLIRVKAPWIKHFYVWDEGHSMIYPGQDNVVLGGTRQKDELDINASSNKWFDDILDRCSQLMPSLKTAEIERKWVGLRPHRSYLRVEQEDIDVHGKTLQVVHNYGHGANGIALSWGTGMDAANKVKTLLDTQQYTKSKL